MNTIGNRRKKLTVSTVGAIAAAAAAAPAVPLVGAGTAQAGVQWTPWVPGVGLTATVTDTSNGAPGMYGGCNYHSVPTAGIGTLDPQAFTYDHGFQLAPSGGVTWQIDPGSLPALQTGTWFHVTVTCTDPNGVNGTVYDNTTPF